MGAGRKGEARRRDGIFGKVTGALHIIGRACCGRRLDRANEGLGRGRGAERDRGHLFLGLCAYIYVCV